MKLRKTCLTISISSLGYDILSFELDGRKKHIEVKTTRSSIIRSFYLSKNEIEFSVDYSDSFYLYRLFDFSSIDSTCKYYKVEGNLKNSLTLTATQYNALPK